MKINRNVMFVVLAGLSVSCLAGQGLFRRGMSPEAYTSALSAALTDLQAQCAGLEKQRLSFGLNLFLAHEAWIRGQPREVLVKAVDAIKEAGATRVDFNPGLFPWLDGDQANIAKYDAVVDRARLDGLILAINPQYSPVVHKLRSFPEWQDAAMKMYDELARRYQPDIFVVAHEPSTMSARLKAKVNVRDWTSFVVKAAKIVKARSPRSRIGAGGLASEQDYFEAFAALPEVDVLTLDIYALRDLKVCGEMIRVAKGRGKPVYIEETWRPPYYRPRLGLTPDSVSLMNVGNRSFENLDSQWIRAMTAWAQAAGLESITPVWLFTLFRYEDGSGDLGDPGYIRAVAEAVMRGERTSTFRTIQELARESGRPQGAPRRRQ